MDPIGIAISSQTSKHGVNVCVCVDIYTSIPGPSRGCQIDGDMVRGAIKQPL